MEESFEFDLRQSSLKVAQEQDRQKNGEIQFYNYTEQVDALEASHPVSVTVNDPKEINSLFDHAISYSKVWKTELAKGHVGSSKVQFANLIPLANIMPIYCRFLLLCINILQIIWHFNANFCDANCQSFKRRVQNKGNHVSLLGGIGLQRILK